MAIEQTTRSDSALQDRLTAAVGGVDKFASNWSWRSHSPEQRAETALMDGAATIGEGIAALTEKGATAEQIDEWTAKAINLWLAYQAAGARTANPMITGPANFPVARNQKAMAAETKRGDEFYLFAGRPVSWLARRHRSADRAALSAEAATVDHRSLEFPGVKLVQNTTLDRIQLLFDGKPDPDTITLLKRSAFRWSPREGAWQRQNTNNGVQAAYRVLRELGHEKGKLNEGAGA
ncbi:MULTISPECIES: hypothetical protein [Alphaproteobacteria]|uniref:hypothetical protein n=1 Tax=Sphingopyxis sp. TaxID=1908224 RepID=UPI0040332A00